MKLSQVGLIFGVMFVGISFANAAMDTKIWSCENGTRTIILTFDQKDENLTYRICADKKCKTVESNGNAKLVSSVGSHYHYDINGSKIEERLTVAFSANAKMGTIPKDGKILDVEKSTNDSSDPAEKYNKCGILQK